MNKGLCLKCVHRVVCAGEDVDMRPHKCEYFLATRPKGVWIDNGEGDFRCSICKDFALEISDRAVKSDFCPHCGADMRGAE